jgi:hypothetical protein
MTCGRVRHFPGGHPPVPLGAGTDWHGANRTQRLSKCGEEGEAVCAYRITRLLLR